MTADRQPRPTNAARRDPIADLHNVAFLLERSLESTYRIKAFRTAAAALAQLPAHDIQLLAETQQLKTVPGIGERTAQVVSQSLAGQEPEYLTQLREQLSGELAAGGHQLRQRLRGDLHTHSDWSDGGSPIEEMALTARGLGHEYLAMTDHSPRLTVANGLTAARLRKQLDVIAGLTDTVAPLHLLTGIEVDILPSGRLDQDEKLLTTLDIVVASAHSELKMPTGPMTQRLLTAIANPHTDILGHCTNRYVTNRIFGAAQGKTRSGKPRPESQFDAEAVFAACAQAGVAVEINSRPERLDPPQRLLRQALAAGCLFSINTDAHAPGQLDWQLIGCDRAQSCGIPPERIINTWPLPDLLTWTQDHQYRPAKPQL